MKAPKYKIGDIVHTKFLDGMRITNGAYSCQIIGYDEKKERYHLVPVELDISEEDIIDLIK